MTDDDQQLRHELVLANRILAQQGVLDAFGHVSARTAASGEHFWLARSMAPALVAEDDILQFDLDAEIVGEKQATPYLERFIHSAIYRRRPDVGAIVHSHSLSVIPFSVSAAPLRAVFHMGAFIGVRTPVFDTAAVVGPSDLLIRNEKLGEAMAETLGDGPALLLRGHGSVVVGADLRQAVFRAVYLEINARVQSEAMRFGDPTFLSAEETRIASEVMDTVKQRPWELWVRDLEKSGEAPPMD